MCTEMARYSEKEIADALAAVAREMGYTELRSKQKEIVVQFMCGRDIFVCLPTGTGKSLCYSILPGAFDILRRTQRSETRSIVVVVSPLIALMKDQVRALTQRNVRSVYVGEASEDISTDMSDGKYQLIFMSPEALPSDMDRRDMLLSPVFQENLVALVVDEAHYVKKWGDSFRKEFSNLGEVRSLIPESVRIMALTATATKETRKAVCRTLGMVNPVVITESPNKPNFKYILHHKPGTLEETFAPLIEEVRRCRSTTERTIIFCCTYDSCALIYLFMRSRQGKEFTEPIGAPDLSRFRLVDMFSACTHQKVREQILKEFSTPSSQLRIVIAFGMGLDCPNIRTVIHWGPSEDIELYIQETGRAGRDMAPARTILYHGVPDLTVKHLDESMKEYCANKDICRRELLLKHFDYNLESSNPSTHLCLCCDICETKCKCRLCCHDHH